MVETDPDSDIWYAGHHVDGQSRRMQPAAAHEVWSTLLLKLMKHRSRLFWKADLHLPDHAWQNLEIVGMAKKGITGHDEWVVTEALATALVALEQLRPNASRGGTWTI